MRNRFFFSALFLLFTSSLFLLVTACTVPQTVLTPTLAQTPAPSAFPTLAPSATFTPTVRPTRRPISATNTPNNNQNVGSDQSIDPAISPQPTLTPIPVNWLVDWSITEINSTELFYWPWENGNTLIINREGEYFHITIDDDGLSTPFPEPTSTSFLENRYRLSPKGTYTLECSMD